MTDAPPPAIDGTDELVQADALRRGPIDHLTAAEVIQLVLGHAQSLGYPAKRLRVLKAGGRTVLDWLARQPGEGWQGRWVASGADRSLDWIDQLPGERPADRDWQRYLIRSGVTGLLLNRVVLPTYDFLSAFASAPLYKEARLTFQPDLFEEMVRRSREAGMATLRRQQGLNVLVKMVLQAGCGLDQLTGKNFDEFRDWGLRRNNLLPSGSNQAWDLLRSINVLPPNTSFKEFRHQGQRPTAELVDRYDLRCGSVRDVLVRYLDERRPSLDYNSFGVLLGHLVKAFWGDIEEHHSGVSSLHLPDEVAAAWRDRAQFVSSRGCAPRPRKSYLGLLMAVRSFYLDIQEWALDDPSWAAHAVPCPVRRGDTSGIQKHRRATVARMHQRVRDRLPQLPVLVAVAEQHWRDQEAMLAAAKTTAIGETFHHAGASYRRVVYKTHRMSHRDAGAEAFLAEDPMTGQTINLSRREDDAFWSWAIIETLRHTGIRREELLEISHLALVSYRMADTGELVPLLQIVPSKNNQERLLLVSPELASVLATIITRHRAGNGGTVPLTSRYDQYERSFGPQLPHLFQRRPRGHLYQVISTAMVQKLLDLTLARTGLTDAAGRPLKFTAHDFRRMFATEAVTGGLPVHIAARLLGHEDLSTTQAYLAVFQDDLIRSYRSFLTHRRALRPEVEYRDPTEAEWLEFQQHFALRKVELGTCGRPYGTPCKHEHACVRCPMLRIDPSQRQRLIEIIRSLTERVQEAKLNGWLGEAEGLRVSLDAARNKLATMDKANARSTNRTTDLGIPQIGQH